MIRCGTQERRRERGEWQEREREERVGECARQAGRAVSERRGERGQETD